MALILLAEDDPAAADLIREFLGFKGHMVELVGEGVALSLRAQELRPALIISDIMMPGAYGTTAYKSLESAGVVPRIPVLFVSSVDEARAAKVVPQIPRVRFMSKPLDLGRFAAVIAELLALPAA